MRGFQPSDYTICGFLKMKAQRPNRHFLFLAVVFFYLLPLIFIGFTSHNLMSRQNSWMVLTLGFFIIACGTVALMLLMSYWEEALKKQESEPMAFATLTGRTHDPVEQETKVTALNYVDQSSRTIELSLLQQTISELEGQQTALMEDIKLKTEAARVLDAEKKELSVQIEQLSKENAECKARAELELSKKTEMLDALQKIVDEQRTEIEKRLEQIQQLDTKVQDLNYEIKALLYLHDNEPEAPQPLPKAEIVKLPEEEMDAIPHCQTVRTSIEASALLRRCIDTAQKLTGQYPYYGNEASRYREASYPLPITLDQRRLFDGLHSENSGLILVYSQRENKVVFANQQVVPLLGWSQEKCTMHFLSLFHDGGAEWNKSIGLLGSSPEVQTRLLFKTRHGSEKLMHCHLGSIPTGLFKSYIIAVLYPDSQQR